MKVIQASLMVCGVILILFGWHDLDAAFNMKRMNLFLEQTGIGYQMSDSNIFFNMTPEVGHTIGLSLVLVGMSLLIIAVILGGGKSDS